MARTSHRNAVLEAAWHLFWERGYHATSIADIAKAAGLPKGSVYNYFESKDTLLLAAVGRLRLQVETELRSRVLAGTPSPGQIVDKLIDHYIELFDEYGYGRGDIAGNLLSELADTKPELATEIAKIATAWRTMVAQKIWAYATVTRTAQLMERAADLAAIIWAAVQGLLIQMKTTRSRAPLEEARHALRAMVDAYVNELAAGSYGGS